RPNNLGQLAGSCIADSGTPYGQAGAAFVLDTNSVSPAYIDVNAAVHANNPALASIKGFVMGSVSSIDDDAEITVMATKTTKAGTVLSGFLASKQAYNP